MTLPIPGTGTGNPVIDTPPLTFTGAAGLSAAITGLVAAAISVLQGFDVLDAPDPIKIALIGLVGAGIIGWAIAATGDTLARAYALAHVTRTEAGKENQPALQTAANKLAEVYAAANPAVTVPTVAQAAAGRLAPFPAPLQVKVRGNDAQAIAVLVSGEAGKETQRYLVGLPGTQLTWVDDDAISMP
jgi:hypothetical protein